MLMKIKQTQSQNFDLACVISRAVKSKGMFAYLNKANKQLVDRPMAVTNKDKVCLSTSVETKS